MKSRTTLALWMTAVALFAVGVAVHIWCGDFPKGIDVLPDERRYLDIARSLFAGEGLVIRGASSDFQKILYPLSLFPALLFPNGDDQIRAVNVLNSIYACSTVFPALAIARKLFDRPAVIVGCMALAIISPDLMYSMTFMSESVFMPLALWLVFLCWRCFESSGKLELVLAGCAGLLCYATYLCKEVAWMFFIAFVAVYLVAAIRHRRTKGCATACISLFVLGFFVPFVAMKLTLFSGLFNSYGQFSFDILLSPYTVLFALYSLAVDGTYFVVGFGIFPVIFIMCTYALLEHEERDLALFCLVALAIGLACVVFTISMREDVGHVALRQHLRYVAPLSLPLLFLFMKQGTRIVPEGITARRRRAAALAGITAGFCVLVGAFFGTANLSQGFDNSQFHFMRWFLDQSGALAQDRFDSWAQTISAIDTDDGALLIIEPLNWICRMAVIVFTLGGTFLLMSQQPLIRRRATLVITAVIAAFMVANSVCAFLYNRNAYDVEQVEVDEICAVSDQLAAREGTGHVVVALDTANTRPNNLIDTYLQDGAGDYDYISVDHIDDYLYPGGPGRAPNALVEYILVNPKQHIGSIVDNAQVIGGNGTDDGLFILYRVGGTGQSGRVNQDQSDLTSRLTDRILQGS